MELVMFFEIHQPLRIRPLVRDPLASAKMDPADMFSWEVNEEVFQRVATKVYTRASRILLDALRESEEFKFTISVSGMALELMERRSRESLEVLADLVATERVEPAAQTYYHSLAWFADRAEFADQVSEHVRKIEEVFGVRPLAAENTEFIYNNEVACALESLGFKITVTEGLESLRGFVGHGHVYKARGCDIKVLLRHYRLSDDVGFRFSMKSWDQYPLTAEKYVSWILSSPGEVTLVAMDYETFGEHQREETGIYEFLRWLPREAKRRGLRFSTLSDVAGRKPVGEIDVPPYETISWADERDVSAWLGNEAQRINMEGLRALLPYARALGGKAIRIWRMLSTSDHFYYQATKSGPAGEVHSYFNPYGSPYVAQLIYQRALAIFSRWLVEQIEAERCAFLKRFTALPEMCLPLSSPICSPRDAAAAIRAGADAQLISRWLKEVALVESLEELFECNL